MTCLGGTRSKISGSTEPVSTHVIRNAPSPTSELLEYPEIFRLLPIVDELWVEILGRVAIDIGKESRHFRARMFLQEQMVLDSGHHRENILFEL